MNKDRSKDVLIRFNKLSKKEKELFIKNIFSEQKEKYLDIMNFVSESLDFNSLPDYIDVEEIEKFLKKQQ